MNQGFGEKHGEPSRRCRRLYLSSTLGIACAAWRAQFLVVKWQMWLTHPFQYPQRRLSVVTQTVSSSAWDVIPGNLGVLCAFVRSRACMQFLGAWGLLPVLLRGSFGARGYLQGSLMQSMQLLFFSISLALCTCVCLLLRPHLAVVTVYSWFCSQGSHLTMFGRLYWVPGIKSGFSVCKKRFGCVQGKLWLCARQAPYQLNYFSSQMVIYCVSEQNKQTNKNHNIKKFFFCSVLFQGVSELSPIVPV